MKKKRKKKGKKNHEKYMLWARISDHIFSGADVP